MFGEQVTLNKDTHQYIAILTYALALCLVVGLLLIICTVRVLASRDPAFLANFKRDGVYILADVQVFPPL